MASPRDIRRLALLALYELDAHNGLGLDGAPRATPTTRNAPARDPRSEPQATDRARAQLAGTLAEVHLLHTEGLSFQDEPGAFKAGDLDRAIDAAMDAWAHRAEADAAIALLAPEWPAHRQAAVDRCILRLSHRAMMTTPDVAKAVVNEAVELAKVFSTEKSPAFVNALLDKVLKSSIKDSTPAATAETDAPRPA